MKCNNAIQSYFESEESGYIPLFVRWHMIFCRTCKNEIRAMQNIFKNARIPSIIEIPEDMSSRIMNRIADSNLIHEKNISFSKWLLTGVVIFSSLFLISYSDSFTWLKQYFGSGLEIPLNIVLGFVITIYAASFIGAHIDEAKKFVEIIYNKMH